MGAIQHEIVLTGPEFRGTTFKPEAMARVAKSLPDSLRDAARMRVFASSRKIGRPGRLIEAATNLWFGDVREDLKTGGTRVTASAPSLGEAAPQLFQQGVLFVDSLSESDTIFDLLGDLAQDVRSGNRDSDRFDAPLLRRLPHVLKDGVETVSFSSHRFQDHPVVLDDKLVQAAGALAIQTPPPDRTRVSGVLEMVSFGDRAFVLKMRYGHPLRGQWKFDDPEPLRPLWGKHVLLEGIVEYKPTGMALSIVAEAIRPAGDEDEFWGSLPLSRREALRPPARRPADRNPLVALYGLGANEGNDEEFFHALETLR